MNYGQLRLCNELSAFVIWIVLKMMSVLFHGFCATMCFCVWVILSINCQTFSVVIFSVIGTFAVRLFLAYFFNIWSYMFQCTVIFFRWVRGLPTCVRTLALCIFSISTKSCEKWHLSMLELTCCLMNQSIDRKNKGWDTIFCTTASWATPISIRFLKVRTYHHQELETE